MGQAAEDLIEGFVCSWCGIYFEASHGYPVLCQACYRQDKARAKASGLQRATEKEL